MKICVVCKLPKKVFALIHHYRCVECHDKIIKAQKLRIAKAKRARIKAFESGDAPKAKVKKAYASTNARRQIEDILDKRKLEEDNLDELAR